LGRKTACEDSASVTGPCFYVDSGPANGGHGFKADSRGGCWNCAARKRKFGGVGFSIVRKVELTPLDRIAVEELISLFYEIEDFIERLQRTGEKWKIR
jgi:hypothetical protein